MHGGQRLTGSPTHISVPPSQGNAVVFAIPACGDHQHAEGRYLVCHLAPQPVTHQVAGCPDKFGCVNSSPRSGTPTWESLASGSTGIPPPPPGISAVKFEGGGDPAPLKRSASGLEALEPFHISLSLQCGRLEQNCNLSKSGPAAAAPPPPTPSTDTHTRAHTHTSKTTVLLHCCGKEECLWQGPAAGDTAARRSRLCVGRNVCIL